MREISSIPLLFFNATEMAIAKAVVIFVWLKIIPEGNIFALAEMAIAKAVVVFVWLKIIPEIAIAKAVVIFV